MGSVVENRAPPAIDPEGTEPGSSRRTAAPRGRILVVDDDEGTRVAVAKLLAGDGFDVITAADGEEALVVAAKRLPDVVLTDLNMEPLGGAELCRRLHAINSDLPVVVMSASSQMDSVVASLRAGAEDYLIKPTQYEAMLWCL